MQEVTSSNLVFSTKSEKAHPVNRWFAGFFVCGREAAATNRGRAKRGRAKKNRGGAKEPGQSEAGAERNRCRAKPGQSETGAERSRGRAKPGRSEAGAERKNRAEEAEADAAADEKTSGRDTMPGRMFRFKECSLTYQSFNQMFFHNFCEFRLE